MDLATQLELLLDVSEHGTFAKAADRNHIDRSALSKQIKKLEDSLGLRLLNRSTRSLSLTNAGEEMVQQARKVRELLTETKKLADTFHSEPRGHLKISSSSFFGRRYLKKAVKSFMHKYPHISVEVLLSDQKVDVISEGYDVVFRIGPIRDSNMIVRKLATNKLAVIASKDFLEQHGNPKTPEELIKLPAVVYSSESFQSDKLRIVDEDETGDIKTLNMNAKYLVNETDLILDAVKDGLGYALIGQFMLEEEIEKQGLVQLLPEYQLATHSEIYAMYSHRNQQPLAKLFIDSVQSEIGTTPIWESYL
ncbi:LysR family transcriptional regulator [Vibrio sp. D404a]|uniref:LysR family transcriptional regulator n=1 Tax=unclassified Vibrio TaxID=2614977 RepID=UPI0025572AF1|nr:MULTISPECIES: LysR family transcriptional regulator [unclassified Vibrio]MDK9738253.1 LysR family transcriptional regulator [Vibrio sp. D404a]MDK9796544.1 LysR family transcriptional regulator [Vibrio sp. D449a]